MALLRFNIVKRLFWRKRGIFALKLLFFTVSVLIFCEFIIYYIVIIQCHWPQLKAPRAIELTSDSVLKAMFIADTHLLGEINGHWLDKLRREWQMERAFQTSLWLLQPEIVFILGDVFDEGKWSSSQAWSDDVRRFLKMFRHPVQTEIMVIVGNHDIGFHYEMTAFKLERFSKVFNFASGKIVTRKGVNFIMVNSVALEGDGCSICRTAEARLAQLSHKLNCSLREGIQHKERCSDADKIPASVPILLQHYPLYRRSDSNCTGEDSAPLDKKNDLFREKYDVLSQEASQKLLWWFQPRLILSGHTHSACEVLHNGKIPEISVPSFSWRNRNNPSFILGTLTSTDFSLDKCFLPYENTVITLYCTAGAVLMVFILARLQLLVSPFRFVQHLITKYKAL
ncbi:metallophosphoesterase 1 isoform X1 [Varanus komodoensis]|uniref:Metallophosphoesterase 1 n=2 Tax=Varanus komodoensis TaxID=61221 RepID=A0A8D2LTY1_VARKO|nr:metallophosphoesterase 1 isoform X1 [Varanus komodoensis]XP_044282467.1 metallophosphoesterase 1 isoform X1 [Varanus komodoensis]